MSQHCRRLACLMALVLSLALTLVQSDSSLSVAIAEASGPTSEAQPVLFRQKRYWIWNTLYVEEEKDSPMPQKIGQLKSSKEVGVKIFKIEGEGANTIFTVDQQGDLYVTKSLNREEKNRYSLKATMFDGKNHSQLEEPEEFHILVTDINDNIPVFPIIYNGSILERSHIGTKVVEAKATDADDPTTANADLRYSLRREGEMAAFEIDIITGVISCRSGTLDREKKSQYVVVVQAQDTRGLSTGSSATTSVTITVTDVNDNIASFTRQTYELQVPENQKLNEKFGVLELEDKDQIQNKDPIFTVTTIVNSRFDVVRNVNKDGNLVLKQALDYETESSYSFTIHVRENNLQSPADNRNTAITKAQVNIKVMDVDEAPVFSKPTYTFTILEETMLTNIGMVTASDPDSEKNSIRYSIEDKDCSMSINPITGQLSTLRKLDRELTPTQICQVKAQEKPNGLHSFVKVNIVVQDINDNEPELIWDEIFVCENDRSRTVLGRLGAKDIDDQPARFSFALAKPNTNFTLKDIGTSCNSIQFDFAARLSLESLEVLVFQVDNSALVMIEEGSFSLNDPQDYSLEVLIDDGGRPPKTSITHLSVKVCQCDTQRVPTQCKAAAALRIGVSVHALIAMLLCILSILVIVILVIMQRHNQNDSLASLKHSGDIHEQLVTYDEEGGGEMDTDVYDVSILTSAHQDGFLLGHSDHVLHPSLYVTVQKPLSQALPTACKGEMAVMIEVKKAEADYNHDGFSYDTLHIYGYEGPESLAGSLSSLEGSSTGSNLDYDFLSDWGSHFKTLAELYGVDGSECCAPY